MKKIVLILLWSLFSILFCPKIFAAEFIKDQYNPNLINYIDDYNQIQQVHIFKDQNIYKGIITTKKNSDQNFSFGLIESTDLQNWQMKKIILTDIGEISNPRLYEENNIKYLLFCRHEGSDFYKIYQTTCDSQYNCSQNITPIIEPIKTQLSEKNGYFAPYIIKDNGQYYLFYGVWGNDGFKIRLALSNDMITWTKCSNNLIKGSDGPFPIISNNNLYLYTHQSNSSGIKLHTASLPLSCSSQWQDLGYILQRSQNYDTRHMIFPSLINVDQGLKLFYSGLGSDYRWSLNSSSNFINIITPTPTPTPTKTPVIIVPGFFGSWNGQAIIHNQSVDQSEWKIPTFITEYQGIILTLKNLGYEENKNLFIFSYDWRKNLDSLSNDLSNFINNHSLNNFQIIGHSLGGVIGRLYSQKNNFNKIKKLITVGSPHMGTPHVYKPVSAGEIDQDNTLLWLTEKLILMLNKSTVESDKQTLNKNFPILKDLMPVYDFLVKNNQLISINNMSLKNNYLLTMNDYQFSQYPITTITGNSIDTLSKYEVVNQTFFDKLFNNYIDGRPTKKIFEAGDSLISEISSNFPKTDNFINLNHGELIYKTQGIKSILDLLNIKYHDDKIIEGRPTTVSPSLIFLIRSPITLIITYDNQVFYEDDGIIFIPNAQEGLYNIKATGTDSGLYEILVGQISNHQNQWSIIKNTTQVGQVDDYQINFTTTLSTEVLPNFDNLVMAIKQIDLDNSQIDILINDVLKTKNFYENDQLKKLKSKLLLIVSRLQQAYLKASNQKSKDKIINVLTIIENIYGQSLANENCDNNCKNNAIKLIKNRKIKLEIISKKVFNNKNNIPDINQTLNNLNQIDNKIKQAEVYFENKKYYFVEIIAKTIETLENSIKL